MKTKLRILFFCLAIALCACHSNSKKKNSTTTHSKDSILAIIPEETVIHEPSFVYGIDISSYQKNEADYLNKHKDSLGFIICKATAGISYVDPDFKSNWEKIKKDGFLRGAYHFYFNTDSPVEQAQHLAKVLQVLEATDLPPVVDVEGGGIHHSVTVEEFAKDLLLFLTTLEKELGRKPMIYTNIVIANEYLKDPQLSSYALWIANYVNKPAPDLPETWKDTGWMFWQRSSSYRIDHFTDDSDVFNGGPSKLAEFIKNY